MSRKSVWKQRQSAYYSVYGRKCTACGTNRKICLYRTTLGNQPSLESDEELMPLCQYHYESILKFTASVAAFYDTKEASEIWLRLVKSGKEPGRQALKVSHKRVNA